MSGSIIQQIFLVINMIVYADDDPLIFTILVSIIYLLFDWTSIELLLQFIYRDDNLGVLVNGFIKKFPVCSLTYSWDVGVVLAQVIFESSIWDLMTGRS